MGSRMQTKMDLFEKLAQPNCKGVSRWVKVSEFVGEYESLKLGNGFSWGRKGSPLDKKYVVEVDRSLTSGNGIDQIKLNGFNNRIHFSQTIRSDIKKHFKDAKCVMLGVRGTSVNTTIEIDHKDGRKNDPRISNPKTQEISDFQPLCKAANDAKRQICLECKRTDKRWDAKNLIGNPFSFYEGGADYEGTCVGCYQYDPVAYRLVTCKKLIELTSQDLLGRVYPELSKELIETLIKK